MDMEEEVSAVRRQAILPGGLSSISKTTLARALKCLLREEHGREFGMVSIDGLLEMLPEACARRVLRALE